MVFNVNQDRIMLNFSSGSFSHRALEILSKTDPIGFTDTSGGKVVTFTLRDPRTHCRNCSEVHSQMLFSISQGSPQFLPH